MIFNKMIAGHRTVPRPYKIVRFITFLIVLSIFISVFTSCFREEKINNATNQLVTACEKKDLDAISKLAPNYIYSKSVTEKEAEFNESYVSEKMSYSDFNDMIIYLYLISLLDKSQEISSKQFFSTEFLKCESLLSKGSTDDFQKMINLVTYLVDDRDTFKIFTEGLSMTLHKSSKTINLVPVIVAAYGILEEEYENNYYSQILFSLYDEKEFERYSEAKKNSGREYISVEEMQKIIDDYYSSIPVDSSGYSSLSNTAFLDNYEQIDDDITPDKVKDLFETFPVYRKDICIMYVENDEYRVCFYGCPFKVVGLENKLTGEICDYKMLGQSDS